PLTTFAQPPRPPRGQSGPARVLGAGVGTCGGVRCRHTRGQLNAGRRHGHGAAPTGSERAHSVERRKVHTPAGKPTGDALRPYRPGKASRIVDSFSAASVPFRGSHLCVSKLGSNRPMRRNSMLRTARTRSMRITATLLRSLLVGSTIFSGSVLVASTLTACGDESKPEYWIEKLEDKEWRPKAIERLSQFYE